MLKPDFFPDTAFGWVFCSILVSILIAASVVDFRSLRIPKSLSISCLIVGLLFNLGRGLWLGIQDKVVWQLPPGPVLGTLDGFLFSAAGFASAFAIFFVLWFLKAAGGGDLKLFAAVGAWVGPLYVVYVLIASVMMVVVIHVGMIMVSMLTSGFAQTQKAFSNEGNRKAIQKGKRGKKRGPTYSFPLAVATALVLLIVLRRDLGLEPSEAVAPQVGQMR